MPKHIITEQEYNEVREFAKKNKFKRVDKRLQVIILRYEGKRHQEIADKLGYNRHWVSRLCAEFKSLGINEYARHKYGGNNQAVDSKTEQEAVPSPIQ